MELFCFGIFAGAIIAVIIIGIMKISDSENEEVYKTKLNTYNNGNPKINRGIDNYSSYENGEITNICTLMLLKDILSEAKLTLSESEKDAIKKAIKNTIAIENVYNFIDCKNKEINDK